MTARDDFDRRAAGIVDELRGAGQYKELRAITGPMGPVATIGGREVIVLCSNDYLGLANHPDVVAAGIEGLASHGAGTASVRFICGTLDVHDRLERAVAGLVGTPAALSFVSCWNANEALFPTVTAPGDTIVSDALNHASIIDAVRQTRGVDRKIYAHNDMAELEAALSSADPSGLRWVVTDGVFSMEGDLAPLPEIVRLCRAHDAVVVVDDSHGIGVLGAAGRGTPEHFGILGEVDVVTGTLGKALGGAAGGFVAASERLIELLVQRARPSLFSNVLPATVACSATPRSKSSSPSPNGSEGSGEMPPGYAPDCADSGSSATTPRARSSRSSSATPTRSRPRARAFSSSGCSSSASPTPSFPRAGPGCASRRAPPWRSATSTPCSRRSRSSDLPRRLANRCRKDAV